ncbi:ATP-binding protein [Desulfobacula phenolica]|uniref:4Fe-4S binding domain-containing protein n=1 Tax=Desulfobacula phenolica TaxID=90732 RepID=A0A1H2IMT6_9BACT|nr:4Fe-4S dicluster domain-containing protein [Desulfobacula phenolica]SDU45158.1 4Fe-4S binding domain-containing protein [Desulfobacula phenolica]
MNENKKIYKALQKHLDSQAVGFPATDSGVEIRILKHIFSPLEAKIATCLDFKPEPIETVYKRAKNLVGSKQELAGILAAIEKKGGLEIRVKEDARLYCNIPLVVGMYEFQLGRLSPEFIKDFDAYTSNPKFGTAFLSTKLPQMRTIPIAKSISIKNNVSTFDEVMALLKESSDNFAVCECICRSKKQLQGKSCKVTNRTQTCLAVGDMALTAIRNGMGRQIGLDEAVSILEKNQQEGLILQPSNTQKAEFICSCCGCCCGMLRIHKSIPKPLDFWASNFYAVVDTNACNGCGICEKKCQVGAVKLSEKTRQAGIDLNRCVGCGICVAACPQNAVTLKKKAQETKPPVTREDLYDIIMDKKKGKLGQLKITGKLLLDAVTTGQTHLLR